MKKLNILIVLAVILTAVCMPASADTGRYGRVIMTNTFEGHVYGTDYGQSIYTTDDAHSGVRSRVVDFNTSSSVNMHTNTAAISENYAYYAEVYVKTQNDKAVLDSGAIWSRGNGQYDNRVYLSPELSDDENGWRRFSAYSRPQNGQTIAGIVFYLPQSTALNNGINTLYFDDMKIYVAPWSISAANITASAEETVSLKNVTAYGYDKNGTAELLDTSSGIAEWSVVSGAGYIDKNANLVCTNKNGGTVKVKLTFCGVSTTFNVVFSGGINITAPKKYANGMTIMTVANKGAKAETLNIAVLLYDKEGRLYDAETMIKDVASGATGTVIVPEINVPYNLSGYTKKTIITTAYGTQTFVLE